MRPATFAALLLLPSFQALAADTMMPAGNSPESGFAGVWRVIAAQIDPWSSARMQIQNKDDAPLMEYAIEFEANEIKGPAPLSCKPAKYSSGVADLSLAFGGRLTNDKDGSLAKKLGLGEGAPTVYRTYCGDTTRDYLVTRDANLVTMESGVFYTLERPTGIDPQQYKPGYSGPSFDCIKARTTGERLICRDAALAKADTALAAAFATLRQSVSPASLATFQTAQRAWVDYVNKTCINDDSANDTIRLTECFTTEYQGRIQLLTGLRTEHAGPLTLEPIMRFRRRDDRHIEDSDIYPVMSGGPQAAPFNAFIAKTLATGKWRSDTKDMFPTIDDPGDMRLYAHRTYSVARFDERVVSFQVATSDYTRGNREALAQHSYTWDLAQARPVTLADVFDAGKNWQPFVIRYCKDDLKKQFADRGGDKMSDREIAATIANNANWLWRKDTATVVFNPGTLGGLDAGEFDVDIPLTALKPFIKPGAAILPGA
jgi:uncharacterized protein